MQAAQHLTSAELFALADKARDKGDYLTAESAYRAIRRSRSRFAQRSALSSAAIGLRHILDEKPGAARVRLELARIDAPLGHVGEAARELRAAEAADCGWP